MPDLEEQILTALAAKSYVPLKPKALARKLGINPSQYPDFRNVLRELLQQGRVEVGKNHTVRAVKPHGTVTGLFRRTANGPGFVRPKIVDGKFGPDVAIGEDDTLDAATGDEVLVRLTRKPSRGGAAPRGIVSRPGTGDPAVRRHLLRARRRRSRPRRRHRLQPQHLRRRSRRQGRQARRQGRLRDGPLPDAGRPRRRRHHRGPRPARPAGRRYAVDHPRLRPARRVPRRRAGRGPRRWRRRSTRTTSTAARISPADTIITIDPVDARDFDDAVSLTQRPEQTSTGCSASTSPTWAISPRRAAALDREARKRGTSVYLPQRVMPMFPEIISNGLASLQQGKLRYVKSVLIDFTADGQKAAVRFANGAIRVNQRDSPTSRCRSFWTDPGRRPATWRWRRRLSTCCCAMRDLALILRKRRLKRGCPGTAHAGGRAGVRRRPAA